MTAGSACAFTSSALRKMASTNKFLDFISVFPPDRSSIATEFRNGVPPFATMLSFAKNTCRPKHRRLTTSVPRGVCYNSASSTTSFCSGSSRRSALVDIFEQHSARLEECVKSFTPTEGQLGAVLFGSPDTLKKLWPKLMRSYGLDALDRAGSVGEKGEKPSSDVGPNDVEAFLLKVSAGETKQYAAVGEGDDIRLTNIGLTGAALAARDRVIHLSAFAM
jgi:hypothetical protein